MFQLRDRTRRSIALALFSLLCVAPTVGVLAWALAARSPWHARSEAQRLGWRLGLSVSLSAVKHPRPGVTVYEGLELADPATGRVVIRCPRLEARWEPDVDQEKQKRDFLVLRSFGAVVDTGESEELHRLLDRLLACRVGWPGAFVRWDESEITLRGNVAPTKLAGFRGRVESLSKGTWAGLAFRCEDAKQGKLASICFSRDRQAPSPVLHVNLTTGEASVPCALLALGWGELATLGPQSQFCGEITADLADGTWDGQVRGHFSGVDLDGLVTRRFPHTLSGSGQIFLDHSEFRRGRIEKAAGWLVAIHGGSISRSLLESAARALSLEAPTGAGPEPIQAFEQLGFWFAIDAGELQLQGRCPLESQQGTALVLGRNGLLLDAPRPQPLPAAALVQALVPQGPVQVAAAPQAEWLLERLALAPGPAEEPAAARSAQRPGGDARK